MTGPRVPLFLLLGLILLAVFIGDLLLPLGVAAGVPYVLAVLVSLHSPQRRVTVAVAIIATLLTITGYVLSSPSGVQWMVLTNRALAIFVIWVSAYLLIGRKKVIKALGDAGRRFKAVFDTVPDGVIVIDERGLIESFNPAAANLFGFSSEEVLGKNVSMLMPSPPGNEHDTYLSNYLSTGENKIIGKGREVVARKKDGTLFHVRLAVGEMKLAGYHAFTGILHDLTELRSAEQDSLKDPATGLLNRRAFDKFLASALSRSQTSLLFIDVDKLKSINDELGHLHGDRAINTAAKTISGCLRSTDPGACARIGGDEFAVVLPRSDDDIAMLVATRILDAADPALKSIHPQAGISIGVATAEKDTPPKTLLGAADEALYRAKEKRGVVSR